jgi:hypothetical protein
VVTVTPAPPLGNIPELPSGYVLRGVHTGSPLVPSGWVTNSDGTSGISVFDDPQAPSSPSQVMRVTYPAGWADGAAPVGLEYPGTNGKSRLFLTYWFKYNSSFQGHSSQVNKHIFFFGADGTDLGYSMLRFTGNASQGSMDFLLQSGMAPPTFDTWLIRDHGGNALMIAKDSWHRVSVELIYGGNSTGVVRAWVDGVKVGEITNANFRTRIGVMKIDPTWGGNTGERMTQTGYLYFDEVRYYTE